MKPKNNKCANIVQCSKCCIQSKRATMISEAILTLIGSVAIDQGLEFGWETTNSWLKDALVSSGAVATYAMITSSLLRIMEYRCAPHTVLDRSTQDNPRYFYLATIISQFASAGLSFGVGIGVEALIRHILSITHNDLDDMEQSASTYTSIFVPASITLIKTLSRWGIFKAVNTGIDRYRARTDDAELPILEQGMNKS
jgi:hypothetical protein